MKKLKLYFKQPIYHRDLLKVLLFSFILSISLGIVCGIIDGILEVNIDTFTFRFILYFLMAIVFSSVLIKVHRQGHIWYKIIACLFYLFSLLIFIFMLFLTINFYMLRELGFIEVLRFSFVGFLGFLFNNLAFWNRFIYIPELGLSKYIFEILNFLLSIICLYISFKRVFVYSSVALIY
jgi:hypothetical protein